MLQRSLHRQLLIWLLLPQLVLWAVGAFVTYQVALRYANAAIDAESESADASVLDRLMAGARSIVRIRKAGHSPDDTSVEAVVGRMEAALEDGRIDEVLAHGKKLPPNAARAAEPWLRRLEARRAADRAMADIEAALKSSLTAPRLPAPEPKR